MGENVELFEMNEEGIPYNIRHRGFNFSKTMIHFLNEQTYDNKFHSLYDQLLRSGTSVGANLMEGKVDVSEKDWRNYYSIALKSGNETKYWLSLMDKQKY